MRRPSLTTRLSLLFMLALTGVLLAVGLTFNLLSREHFVDLDRHALHEKLQASQRLLGGLRRADQLEALG
ncbi:MAG: two-component sensor histidine kinase, partial [Pseudomonas sagittaria]|nr:two-component sensor histidine kinase [Pseudomonas sagittaria]